LGSVRLAETTGDVRASSFLFKRILLWYNVLIWFCCTMVLLMIDQSGVHYQTNVVAYFCNLLAIGGFFLVKKKY